MITRPDIVYGVGFVNRYMKTLKDSHWLTTKRILRYINGSLNLSLFYVYSEIAQLVGYSDSDWGGGEDERKSIIEYIFLSQVDCIFLDLQEARSCGLVFMRSRICSDFISHL